MLVIVWTHVNLFVVVSGLDGHKQRFISRMIGLANRPYTHRVNPQTGPSSSTATPSASTPGSARVSANITTSTSASVSMNAQQRSNDHATALMAALQLQPLQPSSPSHKTSVMNRSFYNFHSSSFYNKQSASTSFGEDAVMNVPTAMCVGSEQRKVQSRGGVLVRLSSRLPSQRTDTSTVHTLKWTRLPQLRCAGVYHDL
jgi:hypothetical protein